MDTGAAMTGTQLLDSTHPTATAPPLCVSCFVRVGRVRTHSVLKSVVCGPCWAAHGGRPAAGEIGPTPTETLPLAYPSGQAQWCRELAGQDWVTQIRADGHRNLTAVAAAVAYWADWDDLESRPTWAQLMRTTGLQRRTVARWLLELRLHGWLELIEHGSTPTTRPMSLAYLEGNRAARYALRLPLTPKRALACASELMMTELATELDQLSHRNQPSDQPPTQPEQLKLPSPVELTGTLPLSSRSFKERSTSGFLRARKPVDNSHSCPSEQGKQQTTALRAGSEGPTVPDLSILVPVSRYQMLACAQDLQRRYPVFAQCSAKMVRHLCKPFWRAGWCNRDIALAMDYRPSTFGQASTALHTPTGIAAPRQFIASRLRAWRGTDNAIRPGHWTSRIRRHDTAQQAREQIRARHGQAGVRLLRAGEHTLTAERIAEHGRTMRLSPTIHQAATRARHRAELRAELVARAHAELGNKSTTSTAPVPQPAGATPYDRALARARTDARAAHEPGHRRYR